MNNKNKNSKQKYGQFFTESYLCEDVLSIINKFKKIQNLNILEPSFGKGSFLLELLDKYNSNDIDAFEIDQNIFEEIDGVNTYLNDFILNNIDKKYDLIVGNPPYIELSYSFYTDDIKDKLKEEYKFLCEGRLNLVHLFLYKSFNLLKDNGIIGFLLPSVILTSPYYKTLRKFIYDNYSILHLEEDISFKDVSLKVCLIIIQKTEIKNNLYFSLKDDNYFIIENNLSELYPTIKELGFNITIGDIIWNQNKKILSDVRETNTKILIYSSNIGFKRIQESNIKNLEKKQYISNKIIKYKNCIILPRNINNKLRFYLIKDNKDFVFENHVIIITHSELNKLEKLYTYLTDEKNDLIIKKYFKSTNISKNEVYNIPVIE